MTESEPGQPTGQPGPGARATGDILAARLLAAQRLLSAPHMNGDIRLRLQLRYAAICTSLKMPSADSARGAERLDRLIADAALACGEDSGAQVSHVYSADNAEPGTSSQDCF